MDFLIEFFLDLYMELMLLVIPEKNIGKKHRVIAKILAICVLLLVLTLAVWGIVLLAEYKNFLGIIPMSMAVLLSLLQIVAGIVLYKKHH